MTDTNYIGANDRRKNTDRRHFTYTFYIPERRSGKDRRGGSDRRNTQRFSDDTTNQRT